MNKLKIDTKSKTYWRYMIVRNDVILHRHCINRQEAANLLNRLIKDKMIGPNDDYEIIAWSMPNPNYQGQLANIKGFYK